jgi:hypothetical protein
MVVWGGSGGSASCDDISCDSGARYSPATKTWETIPPSELTTTTGRTAVWTGGEMIVWGGADGA